MSYGKFFPNNLNFYSRNILRRIVRNIAINWNDFTTCPSETGYRYLERLSFIDELKKLTIACMELEEEKMPVFLMHAVWGWVYIGAQVVSIEAPTANLVSQCLSRAQGISSSAFNVYCMPPWVASTLGRAS